jgi:transposase
LQEVDMKVLVEKPCGIDVHKEVLYVCVPKGKDGKEVRKFATDRKTLLEMKHWLEQEQVTVVAMESTGPYWVPVYEVLEEPSAHEPALDPRLVNAEEVKKVPGRKTDVGDAEWLARLAMYGLLNKSFVPPRDQRDLRFIMRTRRSYIENRTEVRNEISEVLETAQLKLSNVVSDVFGVTGTAILRALAKGVTDPDKLAALARGSLREKRAELAVVLNGRVRKPHRLLLAIHLQTLEQIEKNVARLDREAARLLANHQQEWKTLQTIPGVGADSAAGILAEIGPDMEVFQTADRLCSWSGVCPGNNQSAGKKLRGRGGSIRKANQYLITLLIQSAWSAVRKKGSRFRFKYFALKARLGSSGKAIIAVAHQLLRIIFTMLKKKCPYEERGEQISEAQVQRDAERKLRWLQRHGYQVDAKPVPGAKPYVIVGFAKPTKT